MQWISKFQKKDRLDACHSNMFLNKMSLTG